MPSTTQATNNQQFGFSETEKAAMRARTKELKAEAKANKKRADGEKDVMDAINAMSEPDKSMARKVHELVTKTAPELWPKTWYSMPAYATEEGKIVCFYQSAQKFSTRYATFGFQQDAHLDDENMWPVAFALTKITATEEKKIVDLVKQAVI